MLESCRLSPSELGRVVDAARALGRPSAVAGRTLGLLHGWVDLEPPPKPQFVAPTTRRPTTSLASVRRVERWDELAVVTGPLGLPCLGAVDGVVTLAAYCDDGTFHLVLQHLAYDGLLDVRDVVARRRTGLPGSARIGRVGGLYLLGFDSPQEVEVYRALQRYGAAPAHVNVCVRTPGGLVVGPFDGYDDVGAAYEVDGAHHFTRAGAASDGRKDAGAVAARVEVVRLTSPDVRAADPMYDGWADVRGRAARSGAGSELTVVHSAVRGCPCGYRPE